MNVFVAWLTAAALLASALAGCSGPTQSTASSSRSTTATCNLPKLSGGLAPALRIYGRPAEWMLACGYVTGCGTDACPYVIRGWHFDASTVSIPQNRSATAGYGYAIEIKNTTATYLIEDNTFEHLPTGGILVLDGGNITANRNHFSAINEGGYFGACDEVHNDYDGEFRNYPNRTVVEPLMGAAISVQHGRNIVANGNTVTSAPNALGFHLTRIDRTLLANNTLANLTEGICGARIGSASLSGNTISHMSWPDGGINLQDPRDDTWDWMQHFHNVTVRGNILTNATMRLAPNDANSASSMMVTGNHVTGGGSQAFRSYKGAYLHDNTWVQVSSVGVGGGASDARPIVDSDYFDNATLHIGVAQPDYYNVPFGNATVINSHFIGHSRVQANVNFLDVENNTFVGNIVTSLIGFDSIYKTASIYGAPTGKVMNNLFQNNTLALAAGGNAFHENRFIGNKRVLVAGGDEVDARWNWWGCETGPNTDGCDSLPAGVRFTPWLTSPPPCPCPPA